MSMHCWWFGCEMNPQDPSPVEEATCMHCGELISYADMVGDTRHGRMMDRLHRALRLLWPKRCTDCGRKWRACDENVDHIPF